MLRQLTGAKVTTCLATIHTLYRCRKARKPACPEQNDRTSHTSGRLLVDDRSSCRCSRTKDRYSARHASTSLPLIQLFSSSPSTGLLKSCSGATSSPPTTIAGQKQLNPCPMTEREATVESTQFKKSSRNRRASRWNSFWRNWLPTLPSAAITRVPSRKCLSPIGAKRE